MTPARFQIFCWTLYTDCSVDRMYLRLPYKFDSFILSIFAALMDFPSSNGYHAFLWLRRVSAELGENNRANIITFQPVSTSLPKLSMHHTMPELHNTFHQPSYAVQEKSSETISQINCNFQPFWGPSRPRKRHLQP